MLQHARIKWAKRYKYLGQCLDHCRCLPLFFCLVELPLFSSLELHGCCCLVAKLCLTPLWHHGLQPTRLLCPWDSPGNTGVGSPFLLQGSFQTQGSNLSLISPASTDGFITTSTTWEVIFTKFYSSTVQKFVKTKWHKHILVTFVKGCLN